MDEKHLREHDMSDRGARAVAARLNRDPWYLAKLDDAITRAKGRDMYRSPLRLVTP